MCTENETRLREELEIIRQETLIRDLKSMVDSGKQGLRERDCRESSGHDFGLTFLGTILSKRHCKHCGAFNYLYS